MFETKKLLTIGLAVLALACGKEKVCNDDIDDDENGLIDCADVEQCGADPACEVTANSDTGAVRGVEGDIANGNVAFEATTVNIGVDAAVFVAVVTDQADTCALITNQLQVADLTLVAFVALDTTEADPQIAFASGTTFNGNGATQIGLGTAQVIQGGVAVASANADVDSSITIVKLGADGFASANSQFDLVQDLTVEAEFDTDADGDGINDFLAIAPVNGSIDFTNATACPGLTNALLGL